MPDRWDDEDELGRDRLRSRRAREREPEPEREPTLGELIEGSVRKLVTGMVIAGGLIGLGVYGAGRSGGGGSDMEYQITSSADGRTVYRVNTDSGSIVACRDNHCWLMQRGNHNLDDAPPAAATAPAQPQITPAQPGQAQLPAQQNITAPAAR